MTSQLLRNAAIRRMAPFVVSTRSPIIPEALPFCVIGLIGIVLGGMFGAGQRREPKVTRSIISPSLPNASFTDTPGCIGV